MDKIRSLIRDHYALYHGDCVEVSKTFPDETMDYSIFSPPFTNLYCYSDSPNDMGNCRDYNEFFMHFNYLVFELKRLIKKGRLCTVHCADIPAMKERDGYIGLKDFPGDIIRAFLKVGFIYHSRHLIWKDPLIEVTRTKALGLQYKQIQKDSSMCRAGLPDYLLTFRNTGENETLIEHKENILKYCGSNIPDGSGVKLQHNIWRRYASPVWMDIRQTNTISSREARETNDEKHICPLQLDVIERACMLWSNPGDIVFTPFMGVGSEIFGAVSNGRKGIGIELKESYYRQTIRNLRTLKKAKSEGLIK
jgi:hypothetical protein